MLDAREKHSGALDRLKQWTNHCQVAKLSSPARQVTSCGCKHERLVNLVTTYGAITAFSLPRRIAGEPDLSYSDALNELLK